MKTIHRPTNISSRFTSVMSLSFVTIAASISCTNARLNRDVASVLQESSMKATYCSRLGRTSSQGLKTLFIVDMSMSNIGKFSGSKFDSTFGTDNAENRFLAIEKYINDCGAQSTNNQFAVIGFSNGILSVQNTETCTAPFLKTTDQALTAVQGLRKLQKDNIVYYSSNPTVMKEMSETDYSKALDCANKMISKDLSNSSKESESGFYHVFFITDGKPNPDPCSGKSSCYQEKVDLMLLQALGSSASLKLQPVFYGKPEEKDAAMKILAPMALAGKVDQVQVVENLASLNLCELTAKPIAVKYRKESLLAVNLTAKMIQGKLQSDSDMDGISDDQEKSLGYDPTQRRTFGVLDGICKSLGGPNLCRPQTGSCKNASNNLGLNQCDLKALKLDQASLGDSGVDTDADGIPDLVEVVKDSLVNFSDANSDLDGDSLTNRNEMARGSQVNYPDFNLDGTLLVDATESLIRSAVGCSSTQESWSLDVSKLPLVRTLAASESAERPPAQGGYRKYLDLSHEANENVILITFRSIPENDSKSMAEIWGTVIKLNFDPLKAKSSFELNPADFYLIGEAPQ
jgi:hypothetical protein